MDEIHLDLQEDRYGDRSFASYGSLQRALHAVQDDLTLSLTTEELAMERVARRPTLEIIPNDPSRE